jgi:hypothetical protein
MRWQDAPVIESKSVAHAGVKMEGRSAITIEIERNRRIPDGLYLLILRQGNEIFITEPQEVTLRIDAFNHFLLALCR